VRRCCVAGDSFGENALHENIRRNASVGCLTNMELLVLSREKYLEIVADLANSIGMIRSLCEHSYVA
jgi:CRP-like cAMP-binding protein